MHPLINQGAFAWLSWENPVAIWWVSLVLASIVNICLWFYLRFFKFQGVSILSILSFRRNPKSIIWFSFFYVFVCAFRSFLPRADVQRIVLFETWFSTVLVGRTLATVAELAFIAQWSIVLLLFSRATRLSWPQTVAFVILPLIFIAECFSWYAVISTHYLGNVVEESLWGITYIGIGTALIQIWFKLKGPMRLAAGFAVVGSFLYVAFMFLIDVPMYYGRLVEDIENQKQLLGFWQGLRDLNTRIVLTHSIQDWKNEIPWKTLYFTFAVLVSLALCILPLEKEKIEEHLKTKHH